MAPLGCFGSRQTVTPTTYLWNAVSLDVLDVGSTKEKMKQKDDSQRETKHKNSSEEKTFPFPSIPIPSSQLQPVSS
jgi:hypothetical protein